MEFKYHFLSGIFLTIFLYYPINLSLKFSLIAGLSAFLIDIDHYFWYVAKTKDYNPLNSIRWYCEYLPRWRKLSLEQRSKYTRGIFFLHSIPILVVLILLSTKFPQ